MSQITLTIVGEKPRSFAVFNAKLYIHQRVNMSPPYWLGSNVPCIVQAAMHYPQERGYGF